MDSLIEAVTSRVAIKITDKRERLDYLAAVKKAMLSQDNQASIYFAYKDSGPVNYYLAQQAAFLKDFRARNERDPDIKTLQRHGFGVEAEKRLRMETACQKLLDIVPVGDVVALSKEKLARIKDKAEHAQKVRVGDDFPDEPQKDVLDRIANNILNGNEAFEGLDEKERMNVRTLMNYQTKHTDVAGYASYIGLMPGERFKDILLALLNGLRPSDTRTEAKRYVDLLERRRKEQKDKSQATRIELLKWRFENPGCVGGNWPGRDRYESDLRELESPGSFARYMDRTNAEKTLSAPEPMRFRIAMQAGRNKDIRDQSIELEMDRIRAERRAKGGV